MSDIEEKIIRNENEPAIEIEKGEQGRIDEKKFLEKNVVEFIKTVKNNGKEMKTELIGRKAEYSMISKFEKGEQNIEEKAVLAGKEYLGTVKEKSTEMEEKFKTKGEILKEVKKINEQIDEAPKNKLKLEEINELKKQRERLFSLLDEYKGGFGEEIGKEAAEKNDFKKMDLGVNKEAVVSDIAKEISKELGNKDSLLSKTMKKIKETEEHIQKLEEGLEKLQEMKETDKRNEAIEIHNASLGLERKNLADLEGKVRKITARMEAENYNA